LPRHRVQNMGQELLPLGVAFVDRVAHRRTFYSR
jgi:hypothetical protein